jgi:metal-sulfur cluster biosynthetic enzyme
MVTESDIRAVLDGVIHPSFGMSLIALNMVRAVRVSDALVEVDLVMNCPGCPVRLNFLPQYWTPPWE